MTSINRKLLAIFPFVILLSSCIGYPISEKGIEYEITGDIDGLKSNHDEKILRVVTKHGTQWRLTPEGPIRRMDGGESIDYYLSKNGSRRHLSILILPKEIAHWDRIINIANQWIAFSVNTDQEYFLIVQFNASGDSEEHSVKVYPAGTVSEMYIDKSAKYIVWKSMKEGYQQYNFESKTKKQIKGAISASEFDDLVKISNVSASYDDESFYVALSETRQFPPAYNAWYYPLSDLVKTKSIKALRTASKQEWYMYRWAVAVNPNTPPDIIQELTGDPSLYVAKDASKRASSIPDEW